jgi:hypothetical protein
MFSSLGVYIISIVYSIRSTDLLRTCITIYQV